MLKKYTETPTFASGDRELNSEEIEFLIFDSRNVNVIILPGVYQIAGQTFCIKLLTADAQMKALFCFFLLKKLKAFVSTCTA